VVDIGQKIQHRDKRSVERATYEAPTLKEFGPVGTLTQGGTGAVIENNPMCGMGSPGRRC
jgi:hypothetical protein